VFTGLISAVGKVLESGSSRLRIQTPFRDLQSGESISVDGVCLTVAEKKSGLAAFDVGPETRRVTTLALRRAGDLVNLERALRIGDRLGGHYVTGHVEGVGRLAALRAEGASRWIEVEFPRALARFVVSKGSIAIDGISLTVASVRGNRLSVMIIPHTLQNTNLKTRAAGDRVNLETDILAKYVLRKNALRS
jgi:riboflavin synthase alpha subunit